MPAFIQNKTETSQVDEALHWPPAYTIRKSNRAKHLQLRVIPGKGLESCRTKPLP